MFMHVDAVTYEGGFKLRLLFNNGVAKVVDLKDELSGPVFEPLRNREVFCLVAVNRDTGTIEWPNGADFSPEVLYELGVVVDSTPTLKVAEARVPYG